ncbi:MAG: polysaccharide deacetylase [Acidobacteriaceae bacterium]|nr:polysaccharide deacetylase [Acidobacteriaceae bacterium]
MNSPLTIVMYHYVRDLERSRFPAIKGLSTERFRRQLDHIQAHYTPVRVEDVWGALSSGPELPANAILLTFDDGYSDHFTNVFPLLDARGIQGCFFPPAQAVLEQRVLDVNKIQFLLATARDVQALLQAVFSMLPEFPGSYHLKTSEHYLACVTERHRYDAHEVTILKRLLQREFPEPVRAEIVRRLFAAHVTADEAAFSCELYMSVEQLACLRKHGMHIGSHAYSHVWLNHLSAGDQACEVDQSLAFLSQLGVTREDWTMCYPYGGYNDSLLHTLRERQCRLGFTVEARVAQIGVDDPLTLPRLDTNDLPS